MTLAPTEWPGVHWVASPGEVWSPGRGAVLRVTLENPSDRPLTFGLRVDDSLEADGNRHSRTGGATLPGRSSQTFVFALEDPVDTLGMRGLPLVGESPATRLLDGWGALDTRHLVRVILFFHRPGVTRELRVTSLTLSTPQAAAAVGWVDQLGQYTLGTWPGKVKSPNQWPTLRDSEEADLAAHPHPADRDGYGGWLSGPQRRASGFFRTEKVDGKWWLVTPSGHLFLSFGVNTVVRDGSTMVSPRRELFRWLPEGGDPLSQFRGYVDQTLRGPYRSGQTFDFYSANLQRKYGEAYADLWRDTAAARLGSWGFNTVGNWSDPALTKVGLPYVATASITGTFSRVASAFDYWGPMPDPFDPRFERACRESLRALTAQVRDDPLCLGYFVDNELTWPADLANADQYAAKYFQVVRDTLKSLDPNHLYLGCRFAQGAPGYAVRAAAKACDVLSFNVYQRLVTDVDWSLETQLDVPCLVGEFHFGALDRGLFHPGLVGVTDQSERASAFEAYIGSVAMHPLFVGAHWFQYVDEPLTGRTLDGENYQIGLVSVADVPYPEMVQAARRVLSEIYGLRTGR